MTPGPRLAIVGSDHLPGPAATEQATQLIRLALTRIRPDVVVCPAGSDVGALVQRVASRYGYHPDDGTLVLQPVHPATAPAGAHLGDGCTHLLRLSSADSGDGEPDAERAEAHGAVVIRRDL